MGKTVFPLTLTEAGWCLCAWWVCEIGAGGAFFMEQNSLGLCWDGESFHYTNELHFVTSELLLAVVLLLVPFLCNSSCVKPRWEDLKCVFELEKWQRPPAWGIKHNSFHSISFQHQYSRKQSWARRTGGILGHLFLSTRYLFKIRWGALIWEGQEWGPEEEAMLLAYFQSYLLTSYYFGLLYYWEIHTLYLPFV